MKKIFFDTRFAFAVSEKSGAFNGGNNYSIHMLELLLSYKADIIVICNNDTENQIQYMFGLRKSQTISIDNLSDLHIEKGDIYYNPLIGDSFIFAKELKALKRKYPEIRIFLTIHDRRHHENWFDKYDGILKKGIKSNWIFLGIGRMVNSYKKDMALKSIMSVSDKIFTVSNYSMQELIKIKKAKEINYFIPGIVFKGEEVRQVAESKMILFVSAGRPEKNFIRALLAFKRYIERKNDKEAILVATGLNHDQKEKIERLYLKNHPELKHQVKLTGYIDNNELKMLYQECRFLLFTSKSEGYGAPVSEALSHGKPVIASWKSSIPEVIGGVGVYINPYSIDSIEKGIAQMMQDSFYLQRLNFISRRKEIWRQQLKLDSELLASEIIGL